MEGRSGGGYCADEKWRLDTWGSYKGQRTEEEATWGGVTTPRFPALWPDKIWGCFQDMGEQEMREDAELNCGLLGQMANRRPEETVRGKDSGGEGKREG